MGLVRRIAGSATDGEGGRERAHGRHHQRRGHTEGPRGERRRRRHRRARAGEAARPRLLVLLPAAQREDPVVQDRPRAAAVALLRVRRGRRRVRLRHEDGGPVLSRGRAQAGRARPHRHRGRGRARRRVRAATRRGSRTCARPRPSSTTPSSCALPRRRRRARARIWQGAAWAATCRSAGAWASRRGGGALVRHLGGLGFKPKEMVDANVALERDGKLRDRFYNRVMFPIRDVQGECIAFGGRIVGEGQPKYLNSQETPLFHKSQVLFGLDRAKAALASTGVAVVVEGYTDVIALYGGGRGKRGGHAGHGAHHAPAHPAALPSRAAPHRLSVRRRRGGAARGRPRAGIHRRQHDAGGGAQRRRSWPP